MALNRLAILILLLLAMAGQAATEPSLVEKLKAGGFNLYIRHAATDWTQSDHINAPGDWESCDPAKVRQLSDKGRADARAIGKALRDLAIPLGEIFASPYCRTMETAELIAGRAAQPTMDLLNLRAETFGGGRDAIVGRARRLLSAPPEAGRNNLFSAHGNLGRAAIGQSLGEGEFVVLMPKGDGNFHIAGTLTLATLEKLAPE